LIRRKGEKHPAVGEAIRLRSELSLPGCNIVHRRLTGLSSGVAFAVVAESDTMGVCAMTAFD
jgi:hypothetical protein